MISIIIRSKDEMPWVKHTLRLLRLQSRQDFEVIAVDSGSRDGSYEYLLDFQPEVIYRIKAEEYIPGKVLNAAIRKSKGEIIVFNNADCIPQNREWLQKLVEPLLPENNPDAKTVAVFCNQVPRPNATPLVQKDYHRAFGDGEIHSQWRHFFSLASSAVLRSAIEAHPFREDIQYSEDIEWSWRMKQMGYRIAYQPLAIVEHSHNYNLKGIAKRYFGEGKAEAVIYHELYQQDEAARERDFSLLRSVILAAGKESLRDIIYLIKHRHWDWIAVAPLYRYMQRYHAYRGRAEGM